METRNGLNKFLLGWPLLWGMDLWQLRCQVPLPHKKIDFDYPNRIEAKRLFLKAASLLSKMLQTLLEADLEV